MRELTVVPLYEVKFPPTTNLPVESCLRTLTKLLNPVPVLNEVSIEPSELSLTMSLAVVPLYVEKLLPQTNIFPLELISI